MKNVPTIGRPSKCAAWGVSGGAAAIELDAGEALAGAAPRAASTGLAWAIRSAVQYCSSEDEDEDEDEVREAGGDAGTNAEGVGGAGAGGVAGRGGCEAEGVEPEGGKAEGLDVEGCDGEDEAECEGAGSAVPAGEEASDAARAAGAASSTVLVPSARTVNHFDLNDLLPERSDDALNRYALVRQFDEDGRVCSGLKDRQRVEIGEK